MNIIYLDSQITSTKSFDTSNRQPHHYQLYYHIMSDNSSHSLNRRYGMLCLFFNIFSAWEFSKRLLIYFSDVSLTLSSYGQVRPKFSKTQRPLSWENLPSVESIRSVVQHFESRGTVANCGFTRREIRHRPVSPAKITRVKALYKQKKHISLRNASRTTNISRH